MGEKTEVLKGNLWIEVDGMRTLKKGDIFRQGEHIRVATSDARVIVVMGKTRYWHAENRSTSYG